MTSAFGPSQTSQMPPGLQEHYAAQAAAHAARNPANAWAQAQAAAWQQGQVPGPGGAGTFPNPQGLAAAAPFQPFAMPQPVASGQFPTPTPPLSTIHISQAMPQNHQIRCACARRSRSVDPRADYS